MPLIEREAKQESHLEALRRKHREKQQEIEQEMARPVADPLALTAMKKQRLRLKEQIVQLEQGRG